MANALAFNAQKRRNEVLGNYLNVFRLDFALLVLVPSILSLRVSNSPGLLPSPFTRNYVVYGRSPSEPVCYS